MHTGSTALHLAVFRGYAEVVEELVSAGAAVDTHDNEGETPLHTAAGQGNLAMVRAMLRARPEVINGSGGVHLKLSPLHRAALGGHLHIMQELVAHGVSLDSLACNERTALHACAMSSSAAAVNFLLSRHVDLEATDLEGCTALHIAAGHRLGSEVTLETLLHAGADMEARTVHGETPLHRACKALRVHSVKMLLQWGSNENAVDANGQTPALVASQLLETQSPGVFRDRLDHILCMLASAPVDRIWRRRGWLVLLRVRGQSRNRTPKVSGDRITRAVRGRGVEGAVAVAAFANCRRKQYHSQGISGTITQTWPVQGCWQNMHIKDDVCPRLLETGNAPHLQAWSGWNSDGCQNVGGRLQCTVDEDVGMQGSEEEIAFRSAVRRIVNIDEDGVFRTVIAFI